MNFKKLPIFITLSLLLLLSHIAFVGLSYWQQKQSTESDIKQQLHNLKKNFDAEYSSVEQTMLQTASSFANSPEIQSLFWQGKQALAKEGGAGGKQTQAIRMQLYDSVKAPWSYLMSQYSARQLHFHLPEENTSFLRVHKPDKFGDNLQSIRHSINFAHANESYAHGYELGRAGSSIRGVVPVFHTDPISKEKQYVGALEAGVSIAPLLQHLHQYYQGHFALLLHKDKVEQTLFPELWASWQQKHFTISQYIIDESSSPDIQILFNDPLTFQQIETGTSHFIDSNGHTFISAAYPFKDFIGQQSPDIPAVGSLIIWQDISPLISQLSITLKNNILYASLSFLILGALLYLVIFKLIKRLEHEIEEKNEVISIENSLLQEFSELSSTAKGEELYRLVVRFLADKLQADYVLFSTPMSDPHFCESKIFIADGQIVENIQYQKEDTPCERIDHTHFCSIPKQVSAHYPNNEMLKSMDAQAFFGVPLHNAQGDFCGSIIVMYKHEIDNDHLIRLLMRHASLRLLSELERINYEHLLQDKLDVFSALIENIPDIICYKDGQGRWLQANGADLDLFQLNGVNYFGKTDAELAPYTPFFKEAFEACMETDEIAWENKNSSHAIEVIPQPDKASRIFNIVKAPLFEESGARKGLVVIGHDITDFKQSESELKLAASVFDTVHYGIMITDAKGTIIRTNPAFTHISGYSEQEVAGKNPSILKSGMQAADFYSAMWTTLKKEGYWEGEVINCRKNGEQFPEWLTITTVKDNNNEVQNYIGLISDLTSKKHSENKIHYLKNFDPLTSLPKRHLFMDRLQQSIFQMQRSDGHVAVLFINLDRFKNINESLGLGVGDQVLKQIAHRLQNLLRDEDSIAWLGADEFALFITDSKALPTLNKIVTTIAQKILQSLANKIIIEEHEFFIGASIGIALYSHDAKGGEALLKCAEQAMRYAKKEGRNRYMFFTDEMNKSSQENFKLELALRQALENNEISLHYQPKVDLKTRKIVSCEALMRWHSPEFGHVSPVKFIPIAEQSGLISELGSWALQEACQDFMHWRQQGFQMDNIAVNLSSIQFTDVNLAQNIEQLLHDNGMEPWALELEITESILMDNAQKTSVILQGLTNLGVRFAIDDFGTGYSSLAYLKRFPINLIKIDRSFVIAVHQNKKDAEICSAIIAMAHGLGMETVAEGVEELSQLEFLKIRGCDLIQGYVFSKPLPKDKFQQLLAQGIMEE